MAYVAINPLIFNAALQGFLQGAMTEQYLTDATQADYAAVALAANAFAQAVDTAVPVDAAITAAGVAVAPTTGTIIEKEMAKAGIIQGLSAAISSKRYSTNATVANWNTVAAAVNALYQESVAQLLTP